MILFSLKARAAGFVSLALTAMPGTALAASHIEVLLGGAVEQAGRTDADRDSVIVDLRLLNTGEEAETIVLPERIEARVAQNAGLPVPEKGAAGNSGPRTIMLTRLDTAGASLSIPAHQFAQARYRLSGKEASAGAMLTIPAWSTQTVLIASPVLASMPRTRLAGNADAPPSPVRQAAPEAPIPAPEVETGGEAAGETGGGPLSSPARQPAPPPTDKTVGNAFLADLSAYQPIYAVYGPGTDARLQISFKYKLFGSSAVGKGPADWRQGLHFAYTQRMLWDLSAASSPFHNIDFQPELIYITPSFVLNNGIALGGQVGLRHESNGRDGAASRSINSFYLAPMAAIPLGSGYRMTVSPRVSVYIGDKSDNPDIIRYRGNAGLFWEIGKDDGLRLSTTARLNFATGKGAFNADVSYPLPRLLGGGPDFYLYLQTFTGYGENLLDYNRYTSRVRIGLALVR